MSTDSEPQETAPPAAVDRGRLLGHLKNTIKHGTVYTLGMVLSRLVGFVMIPVYTRVLTPNDYGVLEMLSLTTDVLALLIGLGIGQAVIRYYYRYDSPAEQGAVVSTAAALLLALCALAAAAGIALAGPLGRLLLGTEESTGLVRLSVIGFVLSTTMEVPMAYLRARQRSATVVALSLGRLLAGLGCNVLFVVVLRWGVAGVLVSSIIASGTFGAYMMITTVRETGLRFSTPILRQLISYGAPLVVWDLGSFVLHYSDRYFLRTYASLDAVGLYSLSYKLAMLIPMFVSGPFNAIWIAKALEVDRREGPHAGPILIAILRYFNIVLVTVAFGIALFAEEALRIATGAAFHGAAGPVPVLAVAMVFFSYRSMSQIGSLIKERTRQIAATTALAAVVALALNFLLIPRWGAHGAALATAGSFIVEFFVMRSLSERVYPLRLGLGLLLGPLAMASVVWLATRVVVSPGGPMLVGIAVKLAAVALFGGGLLVAGAVPREDLGLVREAIRQPGNVLRALRRA